MKQRKVLVNVPYGIFAIYQGFLIFFFFFDIFMTRVKILHKAVCISHCTNILRKIMNPTILQLWVDSRTDCVFSKATGMATGLWEGKLWIQTRKTPFKNIHCVASCGGVSIHIHMCILKQYFFVNTYLIKQYRHPLSKHFCIYPFESPHRFYGIRLELVNKPPLINTKRYTNIKN